MKTYHFLRTKVPSNDLAFNIGVTVLSATLLLRLICHFECITSLFSCYTPYRQMLKVTVNVYIYCCMCFCFLNVEIVMNERYAINEFSLGILRDTQSLKPNSKIDIKILIIIKLIFKLIVFQTNIKLLSVLITSNLFNDGYYTTINYINNIHDNLTHLTYG